MIVGQYLEVVLHEVLFLGEHFGDELLKDLIAETFLFLRVRMATPFLVLDALELVGDGLL